MARFDKSSTKRPKQNAAVAATARGPKRSSAPSIEDTMFFPRLRRHAKWMFVFLAVALGGGFVLFGVGAGGTGVGDILRGGGSRSGVPSISSATKKTQEHPKDVQAWRDLSTALQTDGKTDEAITAQQKVVLLAPKDTDALRELAGLYLAQASAKQRQAQDEQNRVALTAAAGQNLPGLLVDKSGAPLVEDKISSVVGGQSSTKVQELAALVQAAAAQAVDAYKKIVKLQPSDPNVQLELAQAAQQTGDAASAIAAYKAFLKLAPDDPSAAIVKSQLKQLQKQTASASG
jgi:tetratricopeptide (TPR) repeat protein